MLHYPHEVVAVEVVVVVEVAVVVEDAVVVAVVLMM